MYEVLSLRITNCDRLAIEIGSGKNRQYIIYAADNTGDVSVYKNVQSDLRLCCSYMYMTIRDSKDEIPLYEHVYAIYYDIYSCLNDNFQLKTILQ